MSDNDKLKYMYASPSEIIKAVIIFSILMTVLILNIVIFFTCKYLSRVERNRGFDGKHVKRIRVKSASQISREFEKETLRFLMNQLRPSPSQNLDSDISAVSQEESQNILHDVDLTVTVNPSQNSAKFNKTVEQKIEVSDDIFHVTRNEKGLLVETLDEISCKSSNFNKVIPNGKHTEGNTSEVGHNPKNHKHHQNKENDVTNTSLKYVKEDTEIETFSQVILNPVDSENYSINGCTNQEHKSGTIATRNITDTQSVCGKGTKVLLKNKRHQNNEHNSNDRQNNGGEHFSLEEKREFLSVNSNQDNQHNNNIVSITITTDDGLESTLNFGSNMDLSKKKG